MRVAIVGGTFNPIHLGHLLLAQEVLVKMELDEVWLMPNGRPPHREVEGVSAEERYLMTLLACADHPAMQVSRLEIDEPGLSYSYQTVARLKQLHPDKQFYFVSGADALLNYTWKCFDELLGSLERFVVSTRPGTDLSALREKLAAEGLRNLHKVHYLELPLIEISSTAIRERAARGQSIRFFLPRAVEDYIVKRRLYEAAVPERKPESSD